MRIQRLTIELPSLQTLFLNLYVFAVFAAFPDGQAERYGFLRRFFSFEPLPEAAQYA
jgi:hypothetical protein